jgi:hypothetical protein
LPLIIHAFSFLLFSHFNFHHHPDLISSLPAHADTTLPSSFRYHGIAAPEQHLIQRSAGGILSHVTAIGCTNKE